VQWLFDRSALGQTFIDLQGQLGNGSRLGKLVFEQGHWLKETWHGIQGIISVLTCAPGMDGLMAWTCLASWTLMWSCCWGQDKHVKGVKYLQAQWN
jgi:hypothetical protein